MQKSIFFWTLNNASDKPLIIQGFSRVLCLVYFIANTELNVLTTLIS